MALQHITLVAAVTDLIPDVESRALLHAVQQLAWISTGVAWKGWNGTETKCFKCVVYTQHAVKERNALRYCML